MLDPDERRAVAARFRVAEDQVARDHLISHILAALPGTTDVVFYGGTALARTHLPEFRLSEDIDLLARDRPTVATALEASLPRALRREFGTIRWEVPPTRVANEAAPALLSTEDGLRVRVQIGVLDHDRSRWPLERRTVHMRYADVEPLRLWVPTRTAFVAMKMLAWEDRHAPRDLADLAALAELGAIDSDVPTLLRHVIGRTVPPAEFTRMPEATRRGWATQLDHQMANAPDPDECLARVHEAWVSA